MPDTRGRDFCKYIYTTFYIAKADVMGRIFFSQLVSKLLKVNGVTLDECILPYNFIIIIPNSQKLGGASSLKCLTSVI